MAPSSWFVDGPVMSEHDCEVHEETPFLQDEVQDTHAEQLDSGRSGSSARSTGLKTIKTALLAAAMLGCVALGSVLRDVHDRSLASRSSSSQRRGAFMGFDTGGTIQQSSNSTDDDNATIECPSGFVKTHLDMQNHDANMHEDSVSLDHCGKKCKEDEDCKGFEYNPDANHCWISRTGHHCTDKQHHGWMSCVKGDTDLCDEDGQQRDLSQQSSNTTNASTTSADGDAGSDGGDDDDEEEAPVECPKGFVKTHLDMQNHDADMHEETLSLGECGNKCEEDKDCKGFEYNPDASHCWVSRTGHHCTDEQHKGWMTCVKGDTDVCEGKEDSGDEASSSTSAADTSSSSIDVDDASSEECPKGFVKTHLDVQNKDADMHEMTASLGHCGKKCEEDKGCKAFEYNPGSSNCWISRTGHHCTEKQVEGWMSCVKGDTDACEDKDEKRDLSDQPSNATNASTTPADGGSDDGVECPKGFVKTHLDVQNHDADMHEATVSLGHCGKKCNKDKDCKAFEYNPESSNCWISRSGHHCTEKQAEGWMSCVKGDTDACKERDLSDQPSNATNTSTTPVDGASDDDASAECPKGFVKTHLDVQNHDADLHEATVSLGHCGKKCKKDKDCKAFEYNPESSNCWISRSGHHCTEKQAEGWMSCVKGDTDSCEEKDKKRVLADESGNATNISTTPMDGDGASAECPDGFVKTHLDMQNHDADMHEETLSLSHCGKKCAEDEECKGFEYNPDASHCWVSRTGHHCTEKQHKGWMTCVKGKVDECEEKEDGAADDDDDKGADAGEEAAQS